MRGTGTAAATRRAFLTVAAAVAAGGPATLLAACAAPGTGGEAGPGAGATRKPVKIAYWVKWGGTSEEAENAVIAAFQQASPHVTVEGTEDANLAGSGRGDREKFIAALAAGVPPDLIKIDRFMMGGHGAKRTTTLLDDVIKRDKVDMKRFYPATVEEVLYPPGPGGKITALPWNTDDRALIYNKKHFAEAGLDPNSPPKTWEDTAEVAKKLTKMEGGRLIRPGFVAWGAYTNFGLGWHWSAGGQFLKPGPDGKPNRKAAFNDDKMRRVLEYARDNMNSMGGFAAYDEWRQRWGPLEKEPWYNDGVSMGVHGSWMVGNFRRFGPQVDWGVAPAPRPKGLEGTPVTWAGGFALAIPTGIKAEQFDAAWEFVKYYCYGKEAQLLFGSRTGQMPALMEAAEDKGYRESDPRMPVFVEVMKHARIRDVTPAGDEVWSTTPERLFAIGGLADRVYENKLSIADVVNEVEKHVNQTLDTAWAQVGG